MASRGRRTPTLLMDALFVEMKNMSSPYIYYLSRRFAGFWIVDGRSPYVQGKFTSIMTSIKTRHVNRQFRLKHSFRIYANEVIRVCVPRTRACFPCVCQPAKEYILKQARKYDRVGRLTSFHSICYYHPTCQPYSTISRRSPILNFL
jgi:hypothetical protein